MTNAVEKLLEGVEGLSPEFKDKVGVVFAAAVSEAVDQKIAEQTQMLTEASETKTQEAITEQNKVIMETLDVFLNEALEQWLKENAPVLDTKLKAEVAEKLVEHFASFMTEHGAVLNESTTDTVVNFETQIADLQNQLNESNERIAEFTKAEAEAKRSLILESKLSDLADTQKDRVKRILESMDFKDLEDFDKKVGYVVEAVAGTPAKDEKPADKEEDKSEPAKEDKEATEEKKAPVMESTTVETTVDPTVAETLAFMRRGRK